MDDETGEEFTKTVWVDGDTGEEMEEDALVETAAMSALEEKTNAKKSSAPRSPAKPRPRKKIDAPQSLEGHRVVLREEMNCDVRRRRCVPSRTFASTLESETW